MGDCHCPRDCPLGAKVMDFGGLCQEVEGIFLSRGATVVHRTEKCGCSVRKQKKKETKYNGITDVTRMINQMLNGA